MVIESKDEVIYWFNQLPGATRIDILSALLHHCVPLEIRFLATRIESIARRDYSFFLEDELRANSAADMRVLCSADWLSGITPVYMAPPSPVMAPKSNVNESPFSLTDVRYKLVVSLCLLYSTNRQCATLVFNAFRKQLSVKNIKEKFEQTCQMSLASSTDQSYLTSVDLVNQSSSSPASLSSHGESTSTCSSICSCGTSNCNCEIPDIKGLNITAGGTQLNQEFVSQITLLFSLALCHPAFSFEQQSLLMVQMREVTGYFESFIRPSPLLNQLPGTVNVDTVDRSTAPINTVASSTSIASATPLTAAASSTATIAALATSHSSIAPLISPAAPTAVTSAAAPVIIAAATAAAAAPATTSATAAAAAVAAATASASPPPYTNPYYAILDVFQEQSKPLGTLYCYNCGQAGHLGNACEEKTLDDLTKNTTFNLKLEPEAPTVNPGPDVIMARNGPPH